MKALKILLIIFVVFFSRCVSDNSENNVNAQSVPNTTTFSLQDVENAISGTQGSLAQCFVDAIPSYFNATYKAQYYAQFGNQNNLLMFRDYGPHNATCASSNYSIEYNTFNSYVSGVTSAGINAGYSTGGLTGSACCVVFHITATGNETVTAPAGWTTIVSRRTLLVKQVIFYKYYSSLPASDIISISFSGDYTKALVKSIIVNASSLTYIDGGEFASSTSTPSNSFTPVSCAYYVYSSMKHSNDGTTASLGSGWTDMGGGTTSNNGGFGWVGQNVRANYAGATIPSTSTTWTSSAGSCWAIYRFQ